jgi:hypothetical protein
MLGHQLGQDLVLGLHLLLQELDPLLLLICLTGRACMGFDRGASVLEKFLLPTIENVGLIPYSSQSSETGTLSKRCHLRMATFSWAV